MENSQSFRLSLKQVSKSFFIDAKERAILKNVSLEISSDLSYALIGPSGSGKSTLLHLIAGIDEPTRGRVLFGDVDRKKLSYKERAQRVGILFQQPHMIQELSVLENVALPAQIFGASKKESFEVAQDLLVQVGLERYFDAYTKELSGGQQQRAALVRALIQKPRILCADEPTGNLDSKTADKILDLLYEYKKCYRMGLFICSHDPQVVERVDLAFTIEHGIVFEKKLQKTLGGTYEQSIR